MKRKTSLVLQNETGHETSIQKEPFLYQNNQNSERLAVRTTHHDNDTIPQQASMELQIKQLQAMFEKELKKMFDLLKAEITKREKNEDLITEQNQLMATMYNEFSLFKEKLEQKHPVQRKSTPKYRKRS